MTNEIRVVVIDEQPLYRDGVVTALASAFKKKIIEQGATGSDGIRLCLSLDPHIVLLGVTERNEAIETTRAIAEKCLSAKVIYLSTPGDEGAIKEVLQAGARGCLSKIVSGPELVRCIMAVHEGESYVSPSLAAQLLSRPAPRNRSVRNDNVFSTLTVREHKIMQAVALGLTNKEIAIKLVLSDNTVKRYMTQIMQKLHVRNRLEAVLLMRSSGVDARTS